MKWLVQEICGWLKPQFCLSWTCKGHLIQKGLFKIFICTKNGQKCFCTSALAYIRGQIKKKVV